MQHVLKYDCIRLSIWQLANHPNTSTSWSKRCDSIVSLHILQIWRILVVGDELGSMAGDVSRASAVDEPITGLSIRASHHPIVLDWSGESWRSLSRCFSCSVGSLWRITALHAQAVLGDMPSPPAMKAHPLILLFLIIHIISLIPLWAFAAFAATTSLLCKAQDLWSEPIRSLDWSILLNVLGDDLIWRGGYPGVYVPHELKEDIPLIVSWDSMKEVEDVLLVTHLGDCHCSVHIGSISVSGQWPCALILIVDFPINPRCVVVDNSTVL